MTQAYPVPAADVLALYADADFHRSLGAGQRIGAPEVLDRAEDGDVVTLRIRYRFTAPLPSAARRFVNPERLTWVERTELDRSALLARSTIVPDHYDTLMSASAVTEYRDHAEGSTRTIEGRLAVAIPLLGAKVERAIVDGLVEHLGDERQAALQRLGR